MTTNFDSLIEKACRNLEIPYQLIIEAEDFKKAVSNFSSDESGRIIKFHGSLTGNNDRDMTFTMQASLSQVANGLSSEKADLLQLILENYDFFAFGYSGNDDFDIYPKMFTTASAKKSIWCCHADEPPCLITKRQLENDLSADHIDRLIMLRPDGFKINGDTKLIISDLCHLAGIRINDQGDVRIAWNDEFRKWSEKDVIHMNEGSIALIFGDILDRLGSLRDAHRCYESVFSSVRDYSLQIELLSCIGWVYNRLGEYEISIPFLLKYLALASTRSDHNNVAHAYRALGRAYLEGNSDMAFRLLSRGIELARNLSENNLELSAHFNSLGNAYWMQGEFAQAINAYLDGLEISNLDIGKSYVTYCRIHHNLSLCYFKIRDLAESENHNQAALAAYEKIGYLAGMAGCYQNSAAIERLQGHIDKSFEYHWLAHNIWKNIGNENERHMALNNIGDLYRYKSDFKQSEQLHLEVLSFFMRNNGDGKAFNYSIAKTLIYLGALSIETNNLEDAKNFLLEAIAISTNSEWSELQIEANLYMAELVMFQDSYDEARQHLDQAKRISQQNKNNSFLARIDRLYGRVMICTQQPKDASAFFFSANQHLIIMPDLLEMAELKLDEAAKYHQNEGHRRDPLVLEAIEGFKKACYMPGIIRAQRMLESN